MVNKASLLLALLLSLLPASAFAKMDVLSIVKEGDHDTTEYAALLSGGAEMLRRERYGVALETFDDKYPDMVINHRLAKNYGGMDAIYATMPDGEADIVYALYPDLDALYADGLVTDLSAHLSLQDALADWPDIARLLGNGERLFAVPESLYVSLVWLQSPALLETLDVTIDDHDQSWTWSNFFAIGEQLHSFNQANGTDHVFSAPRLTARRGWTKSSTTSRDRTLMRSSRCSRDGRTWWSKGWSSIRMRLPRRRTSRRAPCLSTVTPPLRR